MKDYDITSPKSIETYGKLLEGKSFRDIIDTYMNNNEEKIDKVAENEGVYKVVKKNKGNLGQLIEKCHFGYEPNSNAAPDFEEAGVELKVTPYYKLKRKGFSAKERLVLNIINYNNIIDEKFETSSFWVKNKLLLLIHYLHEEDKDKLDLLVKNVQLFQFPDKDLKIIKDDWKIIQSKVMDGKAHELSERDTNYLSACTKGATSKSSLRLQPLSKVLAKQRAFSLKSSYMTYILRNYILPSKPTYSLSNSIYDEKSGMSFDEYIINRFSEYYGKSEHELLLELNINNDRKAKNIKAVIAARIFNKDLDNMEKAEEIKKANIKVKTIRIEENGKIKESMSFPNFKYTEIVKEEWESSELRRMFLETKFLFVIFRKRGKDYFFEKAMFWTIPDEDLDIHVKKIWISTVKRINAGRADSLPTMKEDGFKVAHVRPKGRNKLDTYPTPTGGHETKKCFWLNNSYILSQVK